MKLIYPAVFHEDDDGIWVEFPDLEGCYSSGDTIEEALDGAKESLEGYCMVLLERKHILPKPSNIKEIYPGENAFVSLVEADLTIESEQKSVEKTLSIPEWMNDYAVANGLNCSAILQEGILTKIRDRV